jgi:hypothetical protein
VKLRSFEDIMFRVADIKTLEKRLAEIKNECAASANIIAKHKHLILNEENNELDSGYGIEGSRIKA